MHVCIQQFRSKTYDSVLHANMLLVNRALNDVSLALKGTCGLGNGHTLQKRWVFFTIILSHQGRIQGGGGSWGQDPPPPFWGTPNFIKREKTLCACVRKRHVLVPVTWTLPFRNSVSAPAHDAVPQITPYPAVSILNRIRI